VESPISFWGTTLGISASSHRSSELFVSIFVCLDLFCVSVSKTSLVAQMVKCLSTMRETRVRSLGREVPWRRKWHPIPVLLPGKSHVWRSLIGYRPWGCKASDTTEQLHFLSLSKMGPKVIVSLYYLAYEKSHRNILLSQWGKHL